jgi:hypothetical protein
LRTPTAAAAAHTFSSCYHRCRCRHHPERSGPRQPGAAHSKCNIEEGKARTRNYKIPVFFHNLKNYDSHIIISSVGKHTSQLSVIPQNYEKFISFSFDHLKFLDSASFLAASEETLVSNLYDKGLGKHKFEHTLHHCKKRKHVDLLLRKGVYPYDYMDGWERFEETKLPPKDKFYNKLNECGITDADYAHAQNVWKVFGCKTLGDYHDLYVESDVLLLADVFENFRTLCMVDDKLDPAHYFTLPNYAWDAMMKRTGIKLELLTDYDMHLMVEQGLRCCERRRPLSLGLQQGDHVAFSHQKVAQVGERLDLDSLPPRMLLLPCRIR